MIRTRIEVDGKVIAITDETWQDIVSILNLYRSEEQAIAHAEQFLTEKTESIQIADKILASIMNTLS